MEEVKTEERQYCVYCHTNIINDKKYIGQTKEHPRERRWGRNGAGYKTQPYFWRAIEKYGWDNFRSEILRDDLTKEEADQSEIELIALYDTTNPSKGYNLSAGGGGPTGVPCPEELKKKYSEMFSGEGNPFYGRHHAEDTKNKLSEIRSIPVIQLGLDGQYITEFKSGREASEATGIDETTINGCCCGKAHCKSGGGFLWVYKRDYNPGDKVFYDHNGLRPVVQLDKLGNFITEYNTIKDASIRTGIHNSNITMCCQGDYNHAGGYIWIYKEEYDPTKTYTYKNPVYKEVVQIDTDGNIIATYESIKEASNTTGIKGCTISRCCAKDGSTAGGFIWKYIGQDYNLDQIKSTNYHKSPTRRPVLQYDLNGNLIAEYQSVADAARSTNSSKTRILECCHGRQEKAKGFMWKWKTEQESDGIEV